MKFVFTDDTEKCWIVEAKDQHNAIAKAVENGFAEDMKDFYCGLDDGQISVQEVQKVLE